MTISPGWYQDPAEPSTQRYWDGAGWIGAPLPRDVTPPEGPLADGAVSGGPLSSGQMPAGPPPSGALPPTATAPPSAGRQQLPPNIATGQYARPWVMVAAPPVRPHGLALATPGSRMWARLIDIGMVLLLNILINGWFVYKYVLGITPIFRELLAGREPSEITKNSQLDSLTIVITLLAMALWFAYEVPATAHSGQTLGKRLMRIKVVRAESLDPLGMLRGWRRWNVMAWPVLLLFCCGPFVVIPQILDVMFVAIDRSQRMALHDRSAATFVVRLPGAAGEKGK